MCIKTMKKKTKDIVNSNGCLTKTKKKPCQPHKNATITPSNLSNYNELPTYKSISIML